ncbi:hypothetical protein [Nocardia lijiangensis]|uniref:hypothetical protein n=1 Tax=Nocardia lijiangensis TaxID=299618 RepID=UPI003D745602
MATYDTVADDNGLIGMLFGFLRGGRVERRSDSGRLQIIVSPENHSIEAIDREIQAEAAKTLGENADFCGGMEASFTMNPPMSDEMRRSVLGKASDILGALRAEYSLPEHE